MKSFMLAGLLTLSFSALAFAGDKGNGGYSVVCRTEQGQITSAELLDIYEGRVIYKRNYAVDLNSVEDLIEIAKSRVENYAGFWNKLNKELKLVNQNIIFIPAGNELEPTEDAFPPIKKRGCKFEQLANYQDSGELLVSQEIYDHLDNVNKAALLIHEAVYSYRRKALGETTSQNSRRLVAQLMANNPDTNTIDRSIGEVTSIRNKRACGLEGTINQRIEDCSYVQPTAPYRLSLVTRTQEGKEVYLDEDFNVLISDKLAGTMNFEDAKKACRKIQPEMGNLPGLVWKLPSIADFGNNSLAYVYGLPNMSNYSNSLQYWTSTVKGRSVYMFNGYDGNLTTNFFKGSPTGAVRCFAEIK